MKAVTTLPAPASVRQPRVNKFLSMGIIYLTSEKFTIFATTIATLVFWVGLCVDDDRMTGFGAFLFLAGFAPWTVSQTLREISKTKLESKEL